MQQNRLPFVIVVLLSLTGTSMPISAQDTANDIDKTLETARLNENPVALQQILGQSDEVTLEQELSSAFLKSRTLPGTASLDAIESWLHENPSAPKGSRQFAYEQIGNRYMALTLYARAAETYKKAADLLDVKDSDLEDAMSLAQIAASVPPIKKSGATGTELSMERDLASLNRIQISISGTTSPMIVDTGAEISVVARSVAERARMRFLDGDVTVGTTTDDVIGRLAVSDTVNIGNMIFHNVLFLVLPDDQLTFADGQYFVDGIIGLPIFTTAQRIGWNDKATKLRLGDTVQLRRDNLAKIFWHEGGVALEIQYGDLSAPAFFDSGASRSSGTLLLQNLLSPQDKNALITTNETRTGVGGAVESKVYTLPNATFTIGHKHIPLNDMRIAGEKLDEAGGDIAIIGSDILARTQSFSVDFTSMSYQLEIAQNVQDKTTP